MTPRNALRNAAAGLKTFPDAARRSVPKRSVRRAARVVLIGYLLLTLAYPGVKFVTDVLIG